MNTPRFTGKPSDDNTERILKRGYIAPAYAAAIAVLIPSTIGRMMVDPALLTGPVTFTATIDTPMIGDELEFQLVADATNRVVTFDGGSFASAGTLTVVALKYGYIKFMYNGAVWQETGRALTA